MSEYEMDYIVNYFIFGHYVCGFKTEKGTGVDWLWTLSEKNWEIVPRVGKET